MLLPPINEIDIEQPNNKGGDVDDLKEGRRLILAVQTTGTNVAHDQEPCPKDVLMSLAEGGRTPAPASLRGLKAESVSREADPFSNAGLGRWIEPEVIDASSEKRVLRREEGRSN